MPENAGKRVRSMSVSTAGDDLVDFQQQICTAAIQRYEFFVDVIN
jgi:hypothetical protein